MLSGGKAWFHEAAKKVPPQMVKPPASSLQLNGHLNFLGDSFFICYWLNQHGKEAMLDMPSWSCQLQQHILADPVNSL